MADIPVEHRVDAVRREALALPDQQSFFGGRNYYGDNGGNFFSRLFGGGSGYGDSQQTQRSRRVQRRQDIQ